MCVRCVRVLVLPLSFPSLPLRHSPRAVVGWKNPPSTTVLSFFFHRFFFFFLFCSDFWVFSTVLLAGVGVVIGGAMLLANVRANAQRCSPWVAPSDIRPARVAQWNAITEGGGGCSDQNRRWTHVPRVPLCSHTAPCSYVPGIAYSRVNSRRDGSPWSQLAYKGIAVTLLLSYQPVAPVYS